jgi:NIMA (never in mitosis gene a)-related kinase 1/4/5
MQGLFKKVNKGVYPKIGKDYSKDLSLFIKIMLQVNPNSRPSCDELINMPMIQQRMKKLCPSVHVALSKQQNLDKLLKTIYVPKYHKDTSKGSQQNKQPMSAHDSEKLDQFVRYIQHSLP